MKKGIYVLPNLVTVCSTFCGFYAIIASFKEDYVYAAWAIMIASIFDGLDGKIARLTHSTSKFGVQLDSLSDVISFGVAPGVLIYTWALQPFGRIGWVGAFLFVVCGALRLARYNVQAETSEAKYFTGLPIPAAAITIASFVLFYESLWKDQEVRTYLIVVLTYLLAFLMVSTVRYHSIKEFEDTKRSPFLALVAAVLVLVVILMHPTVMLFVVSITYVVWGMIEEVIMFKRRQAARTQAVKGQQHKI